MSTMSTMSTPTPLVPQALALWLVDRSRYETHQEHCRRARYLGYHAGPTGYGWRRKAQSIPATTGTLIHAPIAEILLHARAKGGLLPPDDVIYTAIRAALQHYDKIIEVRGLRMTIDQADLEFRTAEQKLLLEGLVWAWCRVILPRLLQEWEIVHVEQEGISIIGCTCGLGTRIGTAEQHDQRGCGGLGWMTRPDMILRRRAYPVTYRYDDIKTAGDVGMNWESAWQYRTQVLAGVLAAEEQLEVKIEEVFIHGLLKGRREAEYNWQTKKKDGAKYQNSKLVYGFCRPAQPPLLREDWQIEYDYIGEDGKNHRLSKDYSRTIILAMESGRWAGCYSPADYWTRAMGPDRLAGLIKVVGPLYPRGDGQNWKLEQFLRQLVAVETSIQKGLWRVHDALQTHGWGDPEVQAILDEEFPQAKGSHCHSYYGDVCEHLGLCNRVPGWESPELLGLIPRRPHHQAELEQAIARGLLPVADGLEQEVED
jgi:hypothetical protein